ncbi:MAG: terminase [Deltaproteobacteria bacterium]|nr:terminase [Deltaproteobacteria bacterium]
MLSAADLATLAEDLAGFTHDPLGYVLYAFPWGEKGTELEHSAGPRPWQREVLDSVGAKLRDGATVHQAIQEAVASGHGIGKSALVSWLVKWALETHEDARGVVTANTEAQLRTKTWPEVSKWHRLSITRELFTCTATSLHSADPSHEKTWRIDALPWSEHNTEAFAGLHNKGKRILLVFDEASKIADKVWEVAEGALTDEGTEILWCVFGNPTRATGRFRECFRKFKHRWRTSQIDSRTVEGTNKAQIQKLIDDNGEDSDYVKVRVRGMFPAQSASQFISETDVDAAFGKHLGEGQYNFAPKILTLDNAWEGDDEIVIGLRQGLAFRILHTQPKNDNDVHVANLLASFEDEHQADAVFIDLGYGTGVVSVGRTLGRRWLPVNFADAPRDPGCLNKRAEMWKAARDWLKEGGAIPKDQVLRDDLLGPETVPRLDGKLQLEAKKDTKARGLPSPNRADALCLSFAFPVAARSLLGLRPGRASAADYNPHARG